MKDSSVYEYEINFEAKNLAAVKELESVGFDKKVLEFGCSTGYVSKILKERGCAVTGIEIDGEAAKKAEAYCERVIVGDIENLDYNRQLGNEKFDVALFGDILEHLKDSKTILLKVKDFLKENGYIAISIPNIAHWSIRLDLLCGRFDYQEMGILDDTHLRFFTKRSIVNLLESSGYFVDSIDYVRQEIDWIKVNSMLKVKGVSESEIKGLSNILDNAEAEAYQYIIKAFPCSESRYFEKIKTEKIRLEEQIARLQEQAQQKDAQINQLQEQAQQKDAQIAQLQEEINQLLQLKSIRLHRKIEGVLRKMRIRR